MDKDTSLMSDEGPGRAVTLKLAEFRAGAPFCQGKRTIILSIYQSFRMAVSLQTRLWRAGKSFSRSLGPLPLTNARWTSSLSQSPLSDLDVSKRLVISSFIFFCESHNRALGSAF